MQQLFRSLYPVQTALFGPRRTSFEGLAEELQSEVLFIACSDSRISPNVLTRNEPGRTAHPALRGQHRSDPGCGLERRSGKQRVRGVGTPTGSLVNLKRPERKRGLIDAKYNSQQHGMLRRHAGVGEAEPPVMNPRHGDSP